MAAYQKTKNEHTDIAHGRFAEAISQIKVVKSYIQEKRELKFFDKHLGVVIKTNRPQSKHWHIQDVKRRLVLNIIFLWCVFVCVLSRTRGDLTAGQAVALILFAMNIRIPILHYQLACGADQKAVADSKDYFEIMTIKPAIVTRGGGRAHYK